jgi:uncharacterized protein YqjF (DUF2071 family)
MGDILFHMTALKWPSKYCCSPNSMTFPETVLNQRTYTENNPLRAARFFDVDSMPN